MAASLSKTRAKTEDLNIPDVLIPAINLEEEKSATEFDDDGIIFTEPCRPENEKAIATVTNFDKTNNMGGVKPMKNLAELHEQFSALKHNFFEFRNKLFEVVESLAVSPQQPEDEIASIHELESLLEIVDKAEEERSRVTEVRQQALKVLERVLAIFHSDNSDFQPLVECHETARELRQQVSESVGVEVDSEIQALAQGSHQFSQLLGLISERDSQDYQRLAELQAAVSQLFGMPLAMAALTGNLLFREEAKDEVNYSDESDSEDEHFMNENSSGESEVASVENAIAPQTREDSQDQTAVEIIPEEEPLETAKSLPATEAPEETITQKTAITISEEETEHEQPAWNLSTEDTAEAIAQSIKNNTEKNRSAALGDLIWRLLLEEQLSFAYHLARALEQQEPKLDPHLPSWLIRALALSQHLQSNTDRIAHRLKDDFANYTEPLGEDEWNYAVILLLAAASLRPALLAPDTGAYSILQGLPLGKAQLSRLYEYCQVISEYGRQHLPLEPKMLKKATSPAERQKSLEQLERTVENWWSQVQTLDMKHGVASKVWENWLKADGLINSLLNPIRTKNTSALATIRQQVTQLSYESNLKVAARRTEGQVRTARRGKPIPEPIVSRLCKFATQAVDLAREWVDLQQEELDASQKSYIQQQAGQLGKEISAVQDEAIAELNDYEKQKPPLFVLAGISCCRGAIEALRALFDPDEPLPTGKRNPKHIIHAPLLKISSLPMNEEWEADVSGVEQIVDGIVETVASGDRTWEQAFEERCQKRDHEATARIIEYLGVNPSESINIEQLDRKRDRELNDSQICLLDEINKTRIKVEEAVVSGLLRETERADYLAQIDSIENAVETTLRFFEKLAWLERIDEGIKTKRSQEIEDFKQKLDRLEMDREHSDYRRICQVIEGGDLLTANEYIDRIRDGHSLPPEKIESGNSFKDFLEKYPDLEPALERAEGNRATRRDLIKDFSKPASELLRTWLTAKERRQAIDQKCVGEILSHLAWNVARLTVQPVGRYTWIDAETETLQDRNRCPLPAYGSEAKGRYRILCVWDKPTEENLLNAIGETSQGSPVIVFYFGAMTLKMRRDLARLCRQRRRTFIVIDDALILYLCGDGGAWLPVLFDCGLAFTFLEPYTTTAGLVPPEMLYGRERERESIINPMGSCFIYGGRQLGKTVLLRYVQRTFHAPKQGKIALWIDLKTQGICDGKDIDEIWNILATEFKRLGVVPASRSARVKDDELLEQIQTWLEHNSQRRILLLLDEADRFLETDGKKSADKTRGNFIRSARLKGLMDRTNRRFKVVFAGLHNVQRTTKLENHPLAHLGEAICIGPLLNNGEARAARALVERPFASLGYRFESPDLVTRILSQTNYYPSLIQLYCEQLLKHVNNPDFVTFDPTTSPPYIITAQQVDDAYKDRDLRQAIRDRFIWTLQLDERYRVIAYAIAHGSFEDEKDKPDGFSVSWIQDEVLFWWEEGFQDLSSDRIRVLLEEMVGLGVLRQTREGSFTLRNTNVLRLMGTQEEIEEELLRDDREVSFEYESETFETTLDAKNGAGHNSLTVQQQSELTNTPNRVSILCVSESSRYNLKHNLKFQKSKLGDEFFQYLDDLSTKADFLPRLKRLLRNRQKGGTTMIYICDSCSWGDDWVDEAINKVKKLRSPEKPVQLFFVADSKKTWQLVSCNSIDWSKELMVNFQLGFDIIWEPLVKKHNFPTDRATREKICAVTGNWLVLLTQLFQISESENLVWEEALEELNQRLNSPEFAKKQAYFMGFHPFRPQQQQVLKNLAILEEASAEDLTLLIEDITSGIINCTLRWAELLSFIAPVGKKDDGKNCWRIDPVVGRILQAMEN